MVVTRALLSSLLLASLCAPLAACGGDDGGDNNTPTVDAPPATPDAPVTPAKQIGSSCVQSQTDPAGDCGAGFLCVAVQGGSGAWCTKACSPGAGDTCAQGYTGPGLAACIFQLQPEGGGTAITACGVVCSTTNPQQCPNCNGTCPGALACNAPLMDANMNTVGQACR